MDHFNEMNYSLEHEPLLSHLIVLTTKSLWSDFCVLVSQKGMLKYAVWTYVYTHRVVGFCSIVKYIRKYSSSLNNDFIQIFMSTIFLSISVKSGKVVRFSSALKTKPNKQKSKPEQKPLKPQQNKTDKKNPKQTQEKKPQTKQAVWSKAALYSQSVLSQVKPACWLFTVYLIIA